MDDFMDISKEDLVHLDELSVERVLNQKTVSNK